MRLQSLSFTYVFTVAVTFCCLFSFCEKGYAKDKTVKSKKRDAIEVGMLCSDQQATDWIKKQIPEFLSTHQQIEILDKGLIAAKRDKKPIENISIFPANVIGISSWSGYETAYLARRGEIVPIDDFLPDSEFHIDDFYSNQWDAVTFDGKRWGVPWLVDAPVLAYDWEMFEAAGISGPPSNGEETLDYAKRLTVDTDGDGVIDQWGLGFKNIQEVGYMCLAIILQKSYNLIESDSFNLKDPTLKEAFNITHGLWNDGFCKVDKRVGVSRRCGMIFSSVNDVHELLKTGRYRVAVPPSFGQSIFPSGERFYLAVRKSSPKKEKMAWEFIKWVSRSNTPLPEKWRGYPCRKDTLHRGDVENQNDISYKYLDVFLESSSRTVTILPHVRGRNEAAIQIGVASMMALQDFEDVNRSMDMLQKSVNLMLNPIRPLSEDSLDLYK